MFSLPEACQALGARLHFPKPLLRAAGVSIDTRVLKRGDLFVALRGAHQDGHRFLEDAFRKGAAGALIEKAHFDSKPSGFSPPEFKNLLVVADTFRALGRLAAWYRGRFELRSVAITGSVGKTSTKEFLHYLLGRKFSVLANAGNFNNHLGLPLTLFGLRPEHDFCVAELGANHCGEIRELAGLLKPSCAVITQISSAHLEGFGSLEAVYAAKLELLESLAEGSVAILPDDDAVLCEKVRRYPLNLVWVGFSGKANYRISRVEVQGSTVRFDLNGCRFSFPGLAGFFAKNAALALAAAAELGIPLEEQPREWKDVKLAPGRFEEKILGRNVRVIYDGYNANPASFEKALEAFSALEVSGKKILVFADMLELGKEEEKYHEELGRRIAHCPFDYVAAYGKRAQRSIEKLREENPFMKADYFERSEEVAATLGVRVEAGDALLLKASRGMKMEDVLKSFQEKTSASFSV